METDDGRSIGFYPDKDPTTANDNPFKDDPFERYIGNSNPPQTCVPVEQIDGPGPCCACGDFFEFLNGLINEAPPEENDEDSEENKARVILWTQIQVPRTWIQIDFCLLYSTNNTFPLDWDDPMAQRHAWTNA